MSRRPLLAALLACFAAPAAAYDATLFFGDSLTDSGYYKPILGGAGAELGTFTTHPGAVWAELLAAGLGTGAAPANTPGGTDYAQGGARVDASDPVGVSLLLGTQPLSAQVASYLGSHGGRADPNALYTVWGGANDVLHALDAYPDAASAHDYLALTAAQQTALVAALRQAGARYVLVPNLPDIGATPFGAGHDAAQLSAMSADYNRELFAQLSAAGVAVIPMDIYHLLREVEAHPAAYGFANVTDPACKGSSFLCAQADLVAPGADHTHLFADGVHPSAAGHQIVADYVYAQLVAPAQMGMLAETPLRDRAVLVETLFTAAETAARAQGRGLWATATAGRADYGRSAGLAEADGTPLAATVGFDRAVTAGAVGGALTAEEARPDFPGGGAYTRRAVAASLYGRFASGPLGASLAATAGDLHYDTRRRVTLGPAARVVDGATGGSQLSLAAQVDYRFGAGALRHGPLAGVVLQQVHVDGFTESPAAGSSTALAYGSQTRNAAVARLGYRLDWEAGAFTPYLRAALEHDFEAGSRQIAVFAPSVFDAGYYALAGRAEPDAASVVIGTGIRLSPSLSGVVEFDGLFGRAHIEGHAFTAGLRYGF